CHIAAGSAEARDEAEAHRFQVCIKNNRNRRGGCLRGKCSGTAQRDDYGHLPADQVGGKFQKPVLIVAPSKFDCDVTALVVTGLLEAPTKFGLPRCRPSSQGVRWRRSKEEAANDRDCWMLCTGVERPPSRAAKRSDEFAPSKANVH